MPGQQPQPAAEAQATNVSTVKTPASPATPDRAPPPPALSPAGTIGAAAAGAAASGDSSGGAAGAPASTTPALPSPAPLSSQTLRSTPLAGRANTSRPKDGALQSCKHAPIDYCTSFCSSKALCCWARPEHIPLQDDRKVQSCRLQPGWRRSSLPVQCAGTAHCMVCTCSLLTTNPYVLPSCSV